MFDCKPTGLANHILNRRLKIQYDSQVSDLSGWLVEVLFIQKKNRNFCVECFFFLSLFKEFLLLHASCMLPKMPRYEVGH